MHQMHRCTYLLQTFHELIDFRLKIKEALKQILLEHIVLYKLMEKQFGLNDPHYSVAVRIEQRNWIQERINL